MSQLFHPRANALFRTALLAGVLGVAALAAGGTALYRSPFVTRVGVPAPQPVPFSHKHHVAGLGLDCRYCHTTVETSRFAGIPATGVCMSCHSEVWTNAEVLAPVRDSYARGTPLRWTRVHQLPDFVYFDHSIHVAQGVGCSTCHGRVDEMPLTSKQETLWMRWCLDCHEHPEKYVRPRDRVFDMGWEPPADQLAQGRRLVTEYKITRRTDCVTCHR